MDLKTTKIKEIAALSVKERRKLLEQAAEHAAPEYATNKELTTFSDRLCVLDFLEE